ncbi:MAG TPA: HNH endonuclease signature motif containing protein [Chthoniobacterales bacterium]|nr:HNH endonuclease signature motif containing protein [Chthoniobacterales bacterium]
MTSTRGNMHPIDRLTPLCLAAYSTMLPQLPSDIASRLRRSRSVQRHGSHGTLLQFNVWDRHQPTVLHPWYFNYNLVYDPKRIYSSSHDWYLQFWVNTIRLYHNQEEIKAYLEAELSRVCPAPFQQSYGDYVTIKIAFDLPDVDTLPAFIAPHYVSLISAVHPVVVPIIDSFAMTLTKEERTAIIAGRQRVYRRNADQSATRKNRDYTRSIPPSWRRELLRNYANKCASCGVDLTARSAHMDHIVPFSKGGLRRIENFQPLCAPCNLKKGNRTE